MDEERTTAHNIQVTGTDNPMCLCCTPKQPLEAPEHPGGYWLCPLTGKQYIYDPATGTVKPAPECQAASPAAATQGQTQNTRTLEPDLYPKAPERRTGQRVDVSQDTFAGRN